MNNSKIIEQVEEIVSPYFDFKINDFRGGPDPNLEDINVLFLRKSRYTTKEKEQEMMTQIKDLDVGFVEINTVSPFGRYIVIYTQATSEETCDKLN